MTFNKPMIVRVTVAAALLCATHFPAFAQPAQLSRAQALALMGNPAISAAVNACRDDRARLCADVAPGGGRILRCLAAQAPAVSAKCKSALIQARNALAEAGIGVQGLANK
jgi:hypothetical protein